MTTIPTQHGLPVPRGTDIPCPTWCGREHGHPYRADDDGLRRVHTRHLADLSAWGLSLTTDQVEQAASPSGPIDLGESVTALAPASVDFEATRCTSDDLRAMAAALNRAADALADLTSHQDPTTGRQALCGAWNDAHDCHQAADHPGDHRCAGCGDVWNRGPWDDDADEWTHQRPSDRCTDPHTDADGTSAGRHTRHGGEA